MKTHIWMMLVLFLMVLLTGTRQEPTILFAQEKIEEVQNRGQVLPAGRMSVPRAAHTATLLSTGEVLIAGGCEAKNCERRTAATELYQPASNAFIRVGNLLTGRVSHSATRLPDGRVLIAGGWAPDGITATAELYDPTTRTFSPTGSLVTARASHIAVLLQDGRVLLVGGEDGNQRPLATAEIYHPATGQFTQTSRMHQPRSSHVAVLLKDGRVLVTGGHSQRRGPVLASAEIFDPATGKFSPTGDMVVPRHKHAAVTLQDGKVLVLGGSDARDSRGMYRSAELFAPETGSFERVADMLEPRFKFRSAVVLLENGRVLIGGGEFVEVYDPVSQSFRRASGRVGTQLRFATAALLATGRVLIAGGYDDRIQPTAETWLYRP
ncbi:hypothetical protein D6833_05475 [Candidatus Parcubacteria bacterium]|nr:MAG: hypothetical protein D6833_05475 [Candidatus Parcubacteria bacterium]